MDIKEFALKTLIRLKFFLLVILAIFLVFKVVELTHMRIYAEFTELEPFSNLNVYYKGFKIGRTLKVVPSKDFQTTRVTISLNSWHYNLPNNIKARVQRTNKDTDKDYMEIIYPSSPALARIRYGDKIEGEISHNLADLINSVAEKGGLDELKGSANNLLESADSAAKNLGELLQEVTSILKDIHPELATSSKYLTATCANLSKTSSKIERSIDDKTISNSLNNAQISTQNVVRTTQNVADASELVKSSTIPALNGTICSIKTLIENIDEIVKSIGTTLNKRFGGARLIFGSVGK